MGLGERRQKDSRMAAMLKKMGIVRNSGRCPICNKIVATGSAMSNHIRLHESGS